MKRQLLAALGLFCWAVQGSAADFAPPVRLKADGFASVAAAVGAG